MNTKLVIPPMPEPTIGITAYEGRDGNEIITVNRAEFDDVAVWGDLGWQTAQREAALADELAHGMERAAIACSHGGAKIAQDILNAALDGYWQRKEARNG